MFNDVVISVFPNPTTGKLVVTTDLPFNTSLNIDVIDVFGKQVYGEEKSVMNKRFELNLENLSRGVYVLILDENVLAEKDSQLLFRRVLS